MKIKFLVILALIVFSGCKKKALEVKQIGNFDVEFLFEKDGCKMYRFLDAGRHVYWANCEGKTQVNYTNKNQNTTVETITNN